LEFDIFWCCLGSKNKDGRRSGKKKREETVLLNVGLITDSHSLETVSPFLKYLSLTLLIVLQDLLKGDGMGGEGGREGKGGGGGRKGGKEGKKGTIKAAKVLESIRS